MIEMEQNLWNQFEQSGKIDDYLAYKITIGEQGNADND